jgi:hypothetical protein
MEIDKEGDTLHPDDMDSCIEMVVGIWADIGPAVRGLVKRVLPRDDELDERRYLLEEIVIALLHRIDDLDKAPNTNAMALQIAFAKTMRYLDYRLQPTFMAPSLARAAVEEEG